MEGIKDKIREVIDEKLGDELYKNFQEITDEENLFSIGLDSLNIVRLIIGIENEFDIIFEDEEIASSNWKNINLIEKMIRNKIQR